MAAVSFVPNVSFFPTRRAGVVASLAIAGLLAFSTGARAQDAAPAAAAPQATNAAAPQASETLTAPVGKKKKQTKEEKKDDKVIQSKDTKRSFQKNKKSDVLAGVDAKLPDKALYDKAVDATKKGHFDVARLDLQTMLNTYPDSQYQMRAKLAIADSWYKEGGTAALTQAESEYADFRVFFPNAPEAAEAQMRIGDIYFRQMDKPDRDYAKATHAEEEYRRMLTDYPNSVLVPEAKQKLRDVQEVLATRESEIAAFYGTHENWAATIARYQTVVDTYPQYSHIDDTLIGLGDAYEAEARYVRGLKLPEAAKAQLESIYDGNAAAAYRKVVLDHSAALHVEDARDRLAAMNLAIPVPTQEQVAASIAMENSRHSYRLTDRMGLFLLHRPDTVTAARIGEPTLVDPKPTLAPMVSRQVVQDFNLALNPNMVKPAAPTPADANAAPVDSTPTPAVPAAPLQLNEVPNSDASTGSNVNMTVPAGGGADHSSGSGVGGEIIATPAGTPTNGPGPAPSSSAPAYEGLKAVGPANANGLPAIEKPAEAPAAINDASGTVQPATQAPRTDGKTTKPEFDKSDESSSKHKKKKGLKKLDPL